MNRRCFLTVLAVVGLCLAGCGKQVSREPSNWLLVSFEKDVTVTYRFVSDRQTTIDLTGGEAEKRTRPQTMSEKLDMVITYTPVEVDPFGLTSLKAECRSVKVTRSSLSGRASERDAMENLAGKTFTFSLSPTGEIADDTDLQRMIIEIGNTAFAQSRDEGRRIKNPDMISDFIAMQWHLWDSTSTIAEPLDGMQPGQSWQVRQWIPWPAPMGNPPARLTTYTLESFITGENQPKKARIQSTYELTDAANKAFPKPYEGTFQMRGLMGFLRGYQFQSLNGTGTQIFNMDQGLIESDQQQYTLKVNAAFMLPLGDSQPVLTVDQTISIEQIATP